jgi:hypothetical protein
MEPDTMGLCLDAFGTIFSCLLLTPLQNRPGWYERLDVARVTFFGGTLDANFARLKAKRTTVFLS